MASIAPDVPSSQLVTWQGVNFEMRSLSAVRCIAAWRRCIDAIHRVARPGADTVQTTEACHRHCLQLTHGRQESVSFASVLEFKTLRNLPPRPLDSAALRCAPCRRRRHAVSACTRRARAGSVSRRRRCTRIRLGELVELCRVRQEGVRASNAVPQALPHVCSNCPTSRSGARRGVVAACIVLDTHVSPCGRQLQPTFVVQAPAVVSPDLVQPEPRCNALNRYPPRDGRGLSRASTGECSTRTDERRRSDSAPPSVFQRAH